MSQTVFLGAAWCDSMHGANCTDRVVSGAKAAVRLCDTAQTSMALFDSELISDRYTPRTLYSYRQICQHTFSHMILM